MTKEEFFIAWLNQRDKPAKCKSGYIVVGSYQFSPARQYILLNGNRVGTGFSNLCRLLNIESPNLY